MSRKCLYLALVAIALRGVAGGKPTHGGLRQLNQAALLIQAAPKQGIITAPAPEAAPKAQDQEKAPKNAAAAFKIKPFVHADALSRATNGYLDWFLVGYWGCWLVVVLLFVAARHWNQYTGILMTPRHPSAGSASDGTDSGNPAHDGSGSASTQEADGTKPETPKIQRSLTAQSLLLGNEDSPMKEITLGSNFWTLNVVSALGQAKDRQGNLLSPITVLTAAIFMGLLQIFTLCLVVYDIDPSAIPYTVTPSSPWKTCPFTVNCMKFVMVFFLGMSVVAEAGDSYDNLVIALGVDSAKLRLHKRYVVSMPIFHYLITMAVILAGVSVILSCQAVPDILYNSMAILFITQVDELFWNFWERIFEIDANWTVAINESAFPEAQILKKCIIFFPMVLAYGFLGRAWYRDQMPALLVSILASTA